MIDLFVFSVEQAVVQACARGGAAGFVVDWEKTGKHDRQQGFDTQINDQNLACLVNVRRWTSARILVRIDRNEDSTPNLDQVRMAADAGADEILLPMVRRVDEVESVLDLCTRLGIGGGALVETRCAVLEAERLAELPLTRVYVGLNDMAIDYGYDDLFEPYRRGIVDQIRATFDCPFGVAGLTLPGHGHPLPARSLMGALLQLPCEFTFLRRSFHRAIEHGDPEAGIAEILSALALLSGPGTDLNALRAAFEQELAQQRVPMRRPPVGVVEMSRFG